MPESGWSEGEAAVLPSPVPTIHLQNRSQYSWLLAELALPIAIQTRARATADNVTEIGQKLRKSKFLALACLLFIGQDAALLGTSSYPAEWPTEGGSDQLARYCRFLGC